MSIWDYPPEYYVGGWDGHYSKDNFSFFRKFIFDSSVLEKQRAINIKVIELCQKKASINAAKAQWSVREVNLGSYIPYVPIVDIDLRKASHEVAENELNRRIEQQDARIRELQKLVLPWGIVLEDDILTIDALELWFTKYIRFFTKQESLAHISANKVSTCDPFHHRMPIVWYSIALDISLYLSSMLKKDCPSVYWAVNKTNKEGDDVWYNRPVLKCTPSSDTYFFYEVHIWDLTRLLADNNVLAYYWLSREYKKSLTTCQRLIKKAVRLSNSTTG